MWRDDAERMFLLVVAFSVVIVVFARVGQDVGELLWLFYVFTVGREREIANERVRELAGDGGDVRESMQKKLDKEHATRMEREWNRKLWNGGEVREREKEKKIGREDL